VDPMNGAVLLLALPMLGLIIAAVVLHLKEYR
jgi:hypothetical protein